MKHSNIFCGSAGHGTMSASGSFIMVCASLFFVTYLYGVLKAPSWNRQNLEAVRFVLHRFRPDRWWFGLVLLARGLLVSLPAVLAPDEANLVVVLMLTVQLTYAMLVLSFMPWKAEVLNLTDGITSGLLVLVLALTLDALELFENNGIVSSIRAGAIVLMISGMGMVIVGLSSLLVMQRCSSRRAAHQDAINVQQVATAIGAMSNKELQKVGCGSF